MAVCLLGAVLFLTSLDRGYAGNISINHLQCAPKNTTQSLASINDSLIHTGPRSGWCPKGCSCVLTYHVDCTKVDVGVLRVAMLPANSSKIRSLWLDYTSLTRLETEVFKEMKYLKRLSLSNNHLTELNHSLFSDLSNLKYLDLRNNCLASPLHNDLFKSLGRLHTLNLDYNLLTTLDSKLLTPIANSITEITLSNNPFICDCTIRNAVEWFNTYGLSSGATCESPVAGESWKTLTLASHCEVMPKPQVDLPCHIVSRSVQEDNKQLSGSFPLVLVLVAAICGFLLLLCGGLLLYCWRCATRKSTPNLDRTINENKHYDDIRPSDYYYYETIRPVPRHISVMTSSRPGSTPDIATRPQISQTEPHSSRPTTRNDDVGNVRNSAV
jgi:hypothetical protein